MSYLSQNLEYLLDHTNTSPKALMKEFDLSVHELRNLTSEYAYPSPDTLIKLSEFFDVSIDDMLKKDLSSAKEQASEHLKLLVLDVDGVMTDGGMYYSENGDEIKKFNVKDGTAIAQVFKLGLKVGFISSGTNKKLINKRAKRFGVDLVYVGDQPKLNIIQGWCSQLEIGLEDTAYIGDDINDRQLLEQVGLSACPTNAVLGIKRISDVVLTRKGGDACVREFVENYLMKRNPAVASATTSNHSNG